MTDDDGADPAKLRAEAERAREYASELTLLRDPTAERLRVYAAELDQRADALEDQQEKPATMN
jgi:hypothetical protein